MNFKYWLPKRMKRGRFHWTFESWRLRCLKVPVFTGWNTVAPFVGRNKNLWQYLQERKRFIFCMASTGTVRWRRSLSPVGRWRLGAARDWRCSAWNRPRPGWRRRTGGRIVTSPSGRESSAPERFAPARFELDVPESLLAKYRHFPHPIEPIADSAVTENKFNLS